MKAIIFYIALLFLMTSDCVYGQLQGCIENDRFANACTGSVNGSTGCPTWTDECGDGWIRSHGTPNIGTYQYEIKGQIRTGYLAYMWSKSNSDGEGMFTPYLFKRGHSYDVTLTVATTANAAGSIKIYAANGLVQGGLSRCGGPPPSVNKVLIGEYAGSTNGEIDISFTFVNNSPTDLTQIWIYPEGSDGSQYELFVKWVEVCPTCSGEIVYNNGVINTETTRVGSISAGSSAGSGGSGIVTTDGTANIKFYATNVIRLLPEFKASITTGTFTAKVDQCYLLPARKETHTNISRLVRPYDDFQTITTKEENKVTIYPSVTTGPVYITASEQDLQNAEIIVFDQLGKKVLALPKANYSGNATINLGALNNGIYILQVKQPTKTITQKVIVQK